MSAQTANPDKIYVRLQRCSSVGAINLLDLGGYLSGWTEVMS